jgi:hypothetical protein
MLAMHNASWVDASEYAPVVTDGKKDFLLHVDHRDGYGSQCVGYYLDGEWWLYEHDNVRASEAGVRVTHWMRLPPDPEWA